MQPVVEPGIHAAALQAELHRLGPQRLPAPALVRTAHAFHAVPLAELRKLARRWSRENKATPPAVILAVAEALWFSESREAMIVSSMLLEKRRDVRDLLNPALIQRWAMQFDGWELVDNLGMAAIAPWVTEAPDSRFGAIEALGRSDRAWTRRLALVGTLDLAPDARALDFWPRVRALCVLLATDREASIPKAISWVLRTYARHVPDVVDTFVSDEAVPMPALARRETRHFLEFGRKRGTAS